MFFSFYGITKNSKRFKKIIISILISSFLMLSSLRYNNGFDWKAYKNFFDSSNNFDLKSRFELGFVSLNYFIHEYISTNYNIFIFIYSLIALYLIYKYCDYFSKNIYFSFLVYGSFYYLGNIMGQTRQGMALSIIAISIIFLYKKKYILFLGSIFLASLFHKVSYAFFPFFIIYWIFNKFNLLKRKNIIFITLITFIIGNSSIIKTIFLNLNKIFDTGVISYALSYASSKFAEQASFMGLFERMFFLMLIILFIDKLKVDRKNKIIITMYLTGVFIYFLFFDMGIYARRFSSLYKISDIILIPNLLNEIKDQNVYYRVIIYIIFILIVTYRVISVFGNVAGNYIPYNFLWNY
jgi:hypothetical protein